MIAGLKPYPRYKESGVPWLGKVPAHWGVCRLKSVAAINPSKTESLPSADPDSYVAFLPMERVGVDSRIRPELRRVSEVRRGFTAFQRGDVLVAKITPCFENGKGACLDHLPTAIGFGSTEFIVLRPKAVVLSQFLYWITTLAQFRTLGAESMTGSAGQQRVSPEFMGGFPLSVSPLAEQAALVRFLSHADRRFRGTIRRKRKFIALLDEHRKVLMHRAVTRGLDPEVRLRPSGVPWLGDVPRHWDIASLGAVAAVQTGPFGSQLHANEYVSGGIPVINPCHMHGARISEDPRISVPAERAETLERHRLRVGDIVAARRGELGRCALVVDGQEGWICGTGSLRIRPRRDVLRPEYLVQLLGSPVVRDTLSMSSIGSTMDNLSAATMARLRIPVPPLSEQDAITERITLKVSRYEAAERAAQQEIALLREYRTRLISDVVTGKLDVREAAANLPDEPEEPEPSEEDEALSGADGLGDGGTEGDFDAAADASDPEAAAGPADILEEVEA